MKTGILYARKSQCTLARLILRLISLWVFCSPLTPEPALSPMLAVHLAQAEEQQAVTGELTVFAAASLTEPFNAIGKQFERAHPGLKVIYNFGGSPALRTQLEQGARADVFASADMAQMEQAKQSGVVQSDSPVFVKNRLVVIVPKANPGKVTEFRDLAKPGLKLDLANAKVPVGAYSRRTLTSASVDYGADFEKQALANIVSEEDNVKQVVTKVQLGEVDAGIVYVSDVTAKIGQDIRMIAIPDAYNQIAVYPIALTTEVKRRAAAEAFIAFVLSAAGQAILQAHHFLPPR